MRSKRPPNLQKTETDPSIAVVEISDPPFHRIPLRSVSRGFNNSQQETQEKKKEIIFFLQAQVWSPPAERTSSSWQSDPENKASVDQCSASSSQEVNRCVSNPRWRRPHISSCFLSLQTVSLLGGFQRLQAPCEEVWQQTSDHEEPSQRRFLQIKQGTSGQDYSHVLITWNYWAASGECVLHPLLCTAASTMS